MRLPTSKSEAILSHTVEAKSAASCQRSGSDIDLAMPAISEGTERSSDGSPVRALKCMLNLKLSGTLKPLVVRTLSSFVCQPAYNDDAVGMHVYILCIICSHVFVYIYN